MTDLIERLRIYAGQNYDSSVSFDAPELCHEAADEIEWLRQWKVAYELCRRDLTAERDALRARIDGSSKHVAEWTASHGLTFFDAPTDLDGKRVALVVLEDGE